MPDVTYAYYPGCSGEGTSKEYDKSNRAVCRVLGINLLDVPDWNCCGSTPAHQVDHVLSAALCSRNFAQAEDLETCQMLTPCPACLKNMRNALEHLHEPGFADRVNELTKRPLTKEHSIKSVLQVIMEHVTPEGIAKKVKKPLTGLKIVPYYGCLMNRPGKVMEFDDDENPMSLDRIMTALGAEVLDFPFKQECCGAAGGVADNTVTGHLSGRILQMAESLGADAVVVACPLCQMNLDMRQSQANAQGKTKINLPVFYYTQLMGLAFGLDKSDLALNKLIVDPTPALNKIGKAPQMKSDEKAEEKAATKAAPKVPAEKEAAQAEEKEEVGA